MATMLCCRTTRLAFTAISRPLLASSVTCMPRIQHVVVKSSVHTSPGHRQELAPSRPSTHWVSERYVSLLLLGLIPTGIVYPCAAVDYALATVIPLHNHWGLAQVLTDYVHGKNSAKYAKTAWLGISVLQFLGLCYFNYADVGICKAVTMLWHL